MVMTASPAASRHRTHNQEGTNREERVHKEISLQQHRVLSGLKFHFTHIITKSLAVLQILYLFSGNRNPFVALDLFSEIIPPVQKS